MVPFDDLHHKMIDDTEQIFFCNILSPYFHGLKASSEVMWAQDDAWT